jgi:hypothetical protein
MPPITLDDLMRMSAREHRAIMDRAHPLDLEALAGTQYQGVDLSLPRLVNALLWKTFRKTFVRDERRGALRGWNVRMMQHGVDGPRVPMTRRGAPWTFGHYEVRSAEGLRFPRGWRGAHYLDYGVVGNRDATRFAWAPLVAVNEGDPSLLLGWEVVKLGGLLVPLPDYWALRLEGPCDDVVPRPDEARG